MAVIRHGGYVLAARRSSIMSMPLKWEFPGEKIHEGETPEECLRRELIEELSKTTRIGPALAPTTHQYPDFTITLYPFFCSIESGDLIPHEHAEIAWLRPDELSLLDWADADRPVVNSFPAMPSEDSE